MKFLSSLPKQILLQRFLLLVLIGFIGWMILQRTFSPTSQTPHNTHDPASFVEGVTVVQMDQFGNVADEFHAPMMWHYSDDNTTDIDSPEITLYKDNQPPWKITAVRGRVNGNNKSVLLWDNVEASQAASPHMPSTRILTTAITVYPQRKYAETDQVVTALQPGAMMKSLGLRADMQRGTIELLAHVRGTYASTSTKKL
jgi:lipopolysaccharide export system protein LptC